MTAWDQIKTWYQKNTERRQAYKRGIAWRPRFNFQKFDSEPSELVVTNGFPGDTAMTKTQFQPGAPE